MTSFARSGSAGAMSTVWNRKHFSSKERKNFGRRISSPYSKSWCSSTTDQDDNLSRSSQLSQKRKRAVRSDSSCSNYSVLTEDNNVMNSKLDRGHQGLSDANHYSDRVDKTAFEDEYYDDENSKLTRRRRRVSRDSPAEYFSSSESYASSHNVIITPSTGRNLMSKSRIISSSSSGSNRTRCSSSASSDVFSSSRGLSDLRISSNASGTTDHSDDNDDYSQRRMPSTERHYKTLKDTKPPLEIVTPSSVFSSSGSGKTSHASTLSNSSRSSATSDKCGMGSYCSLSSLDTLGVATPRTNSTYSSGSHLSLSNAVVPLSNARQDSEDEYGRVQRSRDKNSARRCRSRSSSRDYSNSKSNRSSCDQKASRYDGPRFEDLPLEWWERSEGCKDAKLRHMDRVDNVCSSREELVLRTTLWKDDIVLEPNMFPYDCPYGVEHFTLWSIHDLSHREIVKYVDGWLSRHHPQVRRWQYDDNSGERSIDLFHVHVFIEMIPFSFEARPDLLYLPPHAASPSS